MQKLTQVMQPAVHSRAKLPELVDAYDAHLFLIVAKCKSLRAAALEAKCSLNTMRNHIARLEDQVGCPLLYRTERGVELTQVGRELRLELGELQPTTKIALPRSRREQNFNMRITATEGLGAFWLVPRIAEFQQSFPRVTVALECKMTVESFNKQTTDIAIQLERPADPVLLCVRLGTLHLMPFASYGYLREHGVPTSLQDGRKHRLVLQIADQVRSDILSALAGDDARSTLVKMTTNSSSSHYIAVSRGIGIGMLPTYSRAITKRIVPIDMELKLRRDIWMVYRKELKYSKVGQNVIQFLKNAFDPVRYPWFSDNFVHPNDFEVNFKDSNVTQLFAGFMSENGDENIILP